MNLDFFKDIRTVQQMDNIYNLLLAKCSEYELDRQKVFSLDTDDYSSLSYFTSSCAGDRVLAHWFAFTNDDVHFGLIRLTPSNEEVRIVCEDRYLAFEILGYDCILAKQDNDLTILLRFENYPFELDNIIKVSDFGYEGYFSLLRFITLDGTISLLCILDYGSHTVWYSPEDAKDLKLWLFDRFHELHNEGCGVDETPISVIMEVYDSCMVNVFNYESQYKRLFDDVR